MSHRCIKENWTRPATNLTDLEDTFLTKPLTTGYSAIAIFPVHSARVKTICPRYGESAHIGIRKVHDERRALCRWHT